MGTRGPRAVCIGNAIVDAVGRADDALLAAHALVRGAMTPVGPEAADRLLADLAPATLSPGGSAANTAAGLGLLGLSTAFLGRVRDDAHGAFFVRGMAEAGVGCPLPAAASGPATSRCIVAVTPDGERTMATHLGACRLLGPDDVDIVGAGSAGVVLVEGYAWTIPGQEAAARRAIAIASAGPGRVALTLSDPSIAAGAGAAFADLVRAGAVDVVLANAAEATAFAGASGPDAAIAALRAMPGTWFVTLGADGCAVVSGGEAIRVPAARAGALVDTTGAGDAFAAGTLAGLAHGFAPARAAALGGLVAAHVVARIGARPPADLAEIARRSGFELG